MVDFTGEYYIGIYIFDMNGNSNNDSLFVNIVSSEILNLRFSDLEDIFTIGNNVTLVWEVYDLNLN